MEFVDDTTFKNTEKKNGCKSKSKKRIIIIFVSLLIISLVFYFRIEIFETIFEKKTETEKYFIKSLKEFTKSGKKSIFLNELTNFKWDKVYIFGPYGDGCSRKWENSDCYIGEGWGLQFIDSKKNYIPVCIKGAVFKMPKHKGGCCFLSGDTQLIYLERKNYHSLDTEIVGSNCND